MQLKNIKKTEGGYTFDVATSEQEVQFLVNLAVGHLMTLGVIKLHEDVDELDIPLEPNERVVH